MHLYKRCTFTCEAIPHHIHGSLRMQVMEFLKANIINLYCTGEAERLLDPLSRLLAFSDREVAQCRAGLERLQNGDGGGGGAGGGNVPLAGAAAAVDSTTAYLGSWFGMR